MEQRSFKGIWIPKEIWFDRNLSLIERVMLVEIDSLDNEQGCYAGNQHFADLFGLSKGRISKIISSLVIKGYIQVKIFRNEQKKIEKRSIKLVKKFNYPMVENDYPPMVENDYTYGRKQPEGMVENDYPPMVENDQERNTIYRNTIKNNNTSISMQNDMFETIWHEYPNKQGKAKALIAYKQAIANGTDPNKILEGVHRYKRHIQANKTEAKYIAHGSTWFNQERWNDELPEPKGQGPIKPVEYQPSADDMAALEELKASGGEPF